MQRFPLCLGKHNGQRGITTGFGSNGLSQCFLSVLRSRSSSFAKLSIISKVAGEYLSVSRVLQPTLDFLSYHMTVFWRYDSFSGIFDFEAGTVGNMFHSIGCCYRNTISLSECRFRHFFCQIGFQNCQILIEMTEIGDWSNQRSSYPSSQS